MKKFISKDKPTHIWILLIVLPFIFLAVTAFAQIILRFTINNSSSSLGSDVRTVVNIISLLLGMVSVLLLLCLPVWIIMLIKNDKPS